MIGIAIGIILIAVVFYPKWSYKQYYLRSEINAKHPDWRPYCGINFLEKDPQWFIDNGYKGYIK